MSVYILWRLVFIRIEKCTAFLRHKPKVLNMNNLIERRLVLWRIKRFSIGY